MEVEEAYADRFALQNYVISVCVESVDKYRGNSFRSSVAFYSPVFYLVKNKMCSHWLSVILRVNDLVEVVFTLGISLLQDQFVHRKNIILIKELLYNISG